MKRKILSLALALMMIVSVAAALPVSASSSNDFIIEGSDIESKTDGSDTIYSEPTAAIESKTNADWADDGYAKINHYSTGVNYTKDIPASGAYKITVAAASTETGTSVPLIKLTLNGNPLVNYVPLAETGASNVVQGVEIGTAYMAAGTDAVIGVDVTNETYLYDIKFEYMGATAAFGMAYNVRTEMGVFTHQGTVMGHASKTPTPTDMPWFTYNVLGTGGGKTTAYSNYNQGYVMYLAYASTSYLQASITVPIDGYYNFYLAGAASNKTSKAKITVGTGTETTLSFALTATTASPVKSDAYRTYLTAGTYDVIIKGSTGNPNIYNLYYEYEPQVEEPATQYTITATADPAVGGTVSPATTTVEAGENVTLTATVNSGYSFAGWYEGENKVSEEATYTFTASADADLTAKFEEKELTADDLRVIVPVASKTSGEYNSKGTSSAAPVDNLGWIPKGSISLCQDTDVTYTVNILADGYYDIYFGAGKHNGKLALDIYDGSEVLAYNCQLNEVTSTSTGATDAKETVVASAWLTKGTHNIRLDGRTGYDYVYGFKLEYTGTTKTRFIFDAASPAGFVSSYALGNYGINNIEWCDYGTTDFTQTGYLEYDLHVSDAGYYTVTLALNSIAGYCDVYIDGELYTKNADINVNSGASVTSDSAVTGTIDVARVYLSAGDHTLKITPPASNPSSCLMYNIKVEKDTVQPAANEIRITNNNCTDVADGSYAGTEHANEVCAEVKTSANAKVFIVNYQDLGNGLMKMANFAEGKVVVTDGSIKIIRTPSIDTTSGTVKAFLWDGTTFAPIAMDSISVVNKPAAE